jgi:hypothetical protein
MEEGKRFLEEEGSLAALSKKIVSNNWRNHQRLAMWPTY